MSDPAKFEPSGKMLAELAKAAKCHANVFREGPGRDVLNAIVAAACVELPEAEAVADGPKHSPASCWRCKGTEWQYQQHEELKTTVICLSCGTKCVTPKM